MGSEKGNKDNFFAKIICVVGYVRNKDEYGKMPFHIVYTIAW
jgi:hypothetical protein